MTRYSVVWDVDLEKEFIDKWVDSDSQMRALLTDIANWIDSNLAVDPDLKGQEQPELIRVLFVPVSAARVSVAYQVLPDERQVRVIRLTLR